MTDPRDTIIDELPDADIDGRGPASRSADDHDLTTFRAVARHVHALPYGRPDSRDAYLDILDDGFGTCSTKHAFLATLAAEHDLDISLVLGVYTMNDANTPGVGAALDSAPFDSVPEAHCYLRHSDNRIDLTDPASTGTLDLPIEQETTIGHAEIVSEKPRLHRSYVEDWAEKHGYDPDYVWEVRDACIEALSDTPTDD